MSKRILLLPLLLFILSCDKTKDPGVDIPKPIDKAIVSTLWNTVKEDYQYKDANGSIIYEQHTVYDEPNKVTIQYKFQDDHNVWRIDKVNHNPSYYGTWQIVREDKKDYVIIKWPGNRTDKYEVTSYTNTLMNWRIISTEGPNLQYTKDGQTYTAASREGTIELHCPCRD